MKYEIQIDIVEKMFRTSSSNKLLARSMKQLIPKKNERFKYVLALVVSILLAYMIAISEDTIPIFRDCVQILTDVAIALFGIVFTGYALFQALIGKEMLIRMLQSTVIKDKEEKSKLQETNEIFAEIMMLEFVCIIIGVILLLLLNCLPEKYIVFRNMILNNSFAGIGIYIYLYLSFITLVEMKSFIFNIVELFNFHAGTRVMEMLQADVKQDE